MLEKHDRYSGSVHEDCRCDPNRTLPQPSVILPATCYSPEGTDCGWYRRCLAKLYPCKGQAEYAIIYGEKFCELYEKSKLEFSENALQWLDAARKCLQLALVPVLHFGQVKPTCEDVRTMAFDSHVPCYVKPYPGLSVCSLSLADWEIIFWTIKSSFLPPTFVETFKASLEVAVICGVIWSSRLPKNVYALSVLLEEKIDGVAASDMFSDDELANAIILHISSSLHWSEDTTVDWYAFAANTTAIHESPTMPTTNHQGRQPIIHVIAAFIYTLVPLALYELF